MSLRTTLNVLHPTLRGFLGNHKLLDVLLIVESGSALWGLKDENSDTDFTGIYLPTLEECILGRTKDVIKGDTNPSKVNTPEDVDIKFLSLHHFIRNLAKGDSDSVAILFAPQNVIEYKDPRMDVFSGELIRRFVGKQAVSSAKGGAQNRYEEFLRKGDPKMLYHACRFLYISVQILKYGRVRLPVEPEWADALRKVKKGDAELGQRLYAMLDKTMNQIQRPLWSTSQTLIDSTILHFYQEDL